MNRREMIAAFLTLALISPQPRHAHRCAQFPGLCLLRTRNRERTLETFFRFDGIRLRRQELNLAGHAMDIGFLPSFLGYFRRRYCFANAPPSILELAEGGMSCP